MGNIKDAINEHQCKSVVAISDRTSAGTVCGSCKQEIAEILAEELDGLRGVLLDEPELELSGVEGGGRGFGFR